jgi:hypothetical protein
VSALLQAKKTKKDTYHAIQEMDRKTKEEDLPRKQDHTSQEILQTMNVAAIDGLPDLVSHLAQGSIIL